MAPDAKKMVRDQMGRGFRFPIELVAAEKVLRKHKVRDISTEILGEGLLADTTRVFRARVR